MIICEAVFLIGAGILLYTCDVIIKEVEPPAPVRCLLFISILDNNVCIPADFFISFTTSSRMKRIFSELSLISSNVVDKFSSVNSVCNCSSGKSLKGLFAIVIKDGENI